MAKQCCADVVHDIAQYVSNRVQELNDLWMDIGVSEGGILGRLGRTSEHIKNLVDDMLRGEREMKGRLVDNIAAHTAELKQLSTELSLEWTEPSSTLSILAREHSLRDQLEEMMRLKVERRRQLKALQTQERALCAELSMAPYAVSSAVVSQEELHELAQHLRMLQKEKDSRLSQLCTLRAEILQLVETLQVSPETILEQEVVCEEPEAFHLTQSNLSSVKDFLQRLRTLESSRKKEHSQLVEKLSLYWARLDVPQQERDVFLEQHSKYTADILGKMQEELSRCKALKAERLTEFLVRLKQELLEWYQRCCIPQSRWKTEHSAEASDALLNELEADLARLKEFYESHKVILGKVQQAEALWKKRLEFEKRAADPSRFNNRGGCLLQEEQERKRLYKQLPRLEREILHSIDSYKGDDMDLFRALADGFRERRDAQSAAHQVNKENERIERERRRQVTQSAGPPGGIKRGAPMTPQSGTSKRIAYSTLSATPSMSLRRRSLKKSTPAGRTGPSGKVPRRQLMPPDKCPTTTGNKLANVTSLQGFTAELNCAGRPATTRSTLLPGAEPSSSGYTRSPRQGPKQIFLCQDSLHV